MNKVQLAGFTYPDVMEYTLQLQDLQGTQWQRQGDHVMIYSDICDSSYGGHHTKKNGRMI